MENGYFDRSTDRGRFHLEIIDASRKFFLASYNLSLSSGEASLNAVLPSEAEVGDHIVLQATVTDPTLVEPFINIIGLKIMGKQERPGGVARPRRKPRGGGSGDRSANHGIALPKVIPVRENDDCWRKHKFTPEVACHVISDPVPGEGTPHLVEHTFYINVDNTSLKTEMKYSKQDPRLLEAKFKYGNVLLGLAMLHQANGNGNIRASNEEGGDGPSVQDRIRHVSSAVAPVLLPMIDQLSGLNEDDLEVLGVIGDDE